MKIKIKKKQYPFIIGALIIIALAAFAYSGAIMPQSIFGGSSTYLGEFKINPDEGSVRISTNSDFTFTKDMGTGVQVFTVDLKYPHGAWNTIHQASVFTGCKFAKAGTKFTQCFDQGTPKLIEIELFNNPDTGYVIPVGHYSGYAVFKLKEDTYFPPASQGVLYSTPFEFEFDVKPSNAPPICTAGQSKCVGNVVYNCVNGNWDIGTGCAYKCEVVSGTAKCITKPITCGDGSCKLGDETVANCPEDCTSQCEAGLSRCENDQWMQSCVWIAGKGIYEWSRVEDCSPKKCIKNSWDSAPHCEAEQICTAGDLRCDSDNKKVMTCSNNAWQILEDCKTGTCKSGLLQTPHCEADVPVGNCLTNAQCDDNNVLTVDTCDGAVPALNIKGVCNHKQDNTLIIAGIIAALVIIGGVAYALKD